MTQSIAVFTVLVGVLLAVLFGATQFLLTTALAGRFDRPRRRLIRFVNLKVQKKPSTCVYFTKRE